jgi:DNA-binding CsgD family transcriptional regulator
MVRLEPRTVGRGTLLAQRNLADVDCERQLFGDAEWGQLKATFALTARQCEIARLMCSGIGYEAMAAHTGISINTVRMHMRALFAKLGVHDRLNAVLQLISAERERPSPLHKTQDGS